MENPRPEKVAVVDEVRAKLDASEATMITEYRGLDVAATAELRNALREAGGEYKIYKNTLVRFAARDLGLELDELLTGPTAIAFVEDGDPVLVAKALADFAKANPALVIKGGLLGEKAIDEAGIKALADVEPREVLLAKLAGLMAAPMQQLAGLLQALPRDFAYGLQALIDQGGAPGAPADAPAEAPAVEADTSEAAEAADDTPAAEADADAATNTETDQAEESADTEKES